MNGPELMRERKLTDSDVVATLEEDARDTSVVDVVVVLNNAEAGEITLAVGGRRLGVLEALERALRDVVLEGLGTSEAGSGGDGEDGGELDVGVLVSKS